jgi:hypothetical protein
VGVVDIRIFDAIPQFGDFCIIHALSKHEMPEICKHFTEIFQNICKGAARLQTLRFFKNIEILQRFCQLLVG